MKNRPLWIAAMLMAMATPQADARELPVRSFTTADGLGDNRVKRIVSDSRGLLWICTNSGISRFDGAQFQSFGVADGLPFPIINDLLETSDGFWLASNGGGVIRVRFSTAERRYVAFSVDREPTSNRVNRLFRAADGTLWAGTDGGLFRMTVGSDGEPEFTRVGLRRRGHPDEMVQVWSFANDREGTLWVGTRFGLVRLLRDGRIVSYSLAQQLETDHVFALLYTPEDDALWIGHQSGLAILRPPPASSYGLEQTEGQVFEDRAIVRAAARKLRIQPGVAVVPQAADDAVFFDTSDLGELRVPDLVRSQSGGIHVVTAGAVIKFSAGRFARVEDPRLRARLAGAAEDRDGNLWIATQAAGLFRVARHGFITFRESDGLGQLVSSVFEDHAGELIAVSQDWRVSRYDAQRFRTVRANVPASARAAGWRENQQVIEDHLGDWWFATGAGLVRFTGIRHVDDLAAATPILYTTRDGLAQDSINRLFEDSRGDIWIASLIPGREVLTRWDRASGRFQKYSEADGLQPFNAPTSFCEDPHHVLFVTLRDGGIARYGGTGFRILSKADGLPEGNIGGGITDRTGRLWYWSTSGVYRIDGLDTPRLQATMLATPRQLNAGIVGAIVEDAAGNLFISTGQGIAQIDGESIAAGSATPRIANIYTTSDGLAANEVNGAYADRAGRLWFSTTQGLSYYEPEPRRTVAAPQVRIAGLRVAGVDQAVSLAGEDNVSGLELNPGRTQLEIAFFGISFAAGDTLSFEYRLVGAGDDWSAPSPLRSVMFSNLAPGTYAFEVRAVSAAGARSPRPARAVFQVLPPIWRRWWFVALAALAVLSGMTAFERYRAATQREISRAREERLTELERVRRRIAADLHDEIGSSLTQISILSEVAQQQGAGVLPELHRPLAMIATASRELVDAMSDIVWAIDPAKDHLADLTQRMRRLAADTFTATNTTLLLNFPPGDREIKLGANVRREVFLIFKEAVNNIVKHSACTEVAITLAIDVHVLRLELHDNGRGFDPLIPNEGHGLASLRSRAAALGGALTVTSSPGAGAAVILHLPIAT
jgi:signal transduction histidine kinase/ligand-binding sensor domain-containing protein